MRSTLKRGLAFPASRHAAPGATLLIYHRVGGGSPDERDVVAADFAEQVDALAAYDVVPLDTALQRLATGDRSSSVVLTFDDGFADVFEHGWPLLRARQLPFTLYLATAYVGGTMHWEGSTAKAAGPALRWDQLADMVDSGLATIGNHTHTHARPEALTPDELDRCTDTVQDRLGVAPRHFAYTWGIPVPAMEGALRDRFDSAATGKLGRNLPGQDPMRLRRVPVRGSDPLPFFTAKLRGRLGPERVYAGVVAAAKRAGAHA